MTPSIQVPPRLTAGSMVPMFHTYVRLRAASVCPRASRATTVRFQSTAGNMIQRITMFKVLDDAHVPEILDQYKTLETAAQKDGKPYIRECVARETIDDPRRQGYNIAAITTFDSLDDMKFYDENCEAHRKLKQFTLGKIEMPPTTIYMKN
ncbi:hypothetical protein K431DRAFT_281729 [Polychaeton citri CBS 116435]|uniref:Stress-response A/B barrel domain-containing protein n=1 Tax=Polychaeton citri CBS 116435 TaxID=1314669 RepID=A0A9P4QFN9_9PEZI|nr:hypothetical protein K431DRAFT_281729 [Polychaeton citri CBS 116435]